MGPKSRTPEVKEEVKNYLMVILTQDILLTFGPEGHYRLRLKKSKFCQARVGTSLDFRQGLIYPMSGKGWLSLARS